MSLIDYERKRTKMHDSNVARIQQSIYNRYDVNTEKVDEKRRIYEGDLRWKSRTGQVKRAIVRGIESLEKYQDIFFETWLDRNKSVRGWITNPYLEVDYLIYYFQNERIYWLFPWPPLKKFFLSICAYYPELDQKRHDQKNLSCGVPIPLREVVKAVKGSKRFDFL